MPTMAGRRFDRMTNPAGVWYPRPCPTCAGHGRLRATPSGHLFPARLVPAAVSTAMPCFTCEGSGREPVRVIRRGEG